MKSALKILRQEQDAVVSTAYQMPVSFAEAVSFYLSDRKEVLVAGIEMVSSFEAKERSYRIDALGQLIGVLDRKDIPKGKKIPKAKKGESRDEYLSNLARILTPDGWRTKYREKYDSLNTQALESILKRDDVESNQALMTETSNFLRFLDVVERDGKAASINIQRGHLRRIENV